MLTADGQHRATVVARPTWNAEALEVDHAKLRVSRSAVLWTQLAGRNEPLLFAVALEAHIPSANEDERGVDTDKVYTDGSSGYSDLRRAVLDPEERQVDEHGKQDTNAVEKLGDAKLGEAPSVVPEHKDSSQLDDEPERDGSVDGRVVQLGLFLAVGMKFDRCSVRRVAQKTDHADEDPTPMEQLVY